MFGGFVTSAIIFFILLNKIYDRNQEIKEEDFSDWY